MQKFSDPYTPDEAVYECHQCGHRVEGGSGGTCPQCGGGVKNIAVARE